MADQIPDSAKTLTDRDREAAVDLAHSLGLTAEQFTSGADVIIAQALARHVAAPPAIDREAVERDDLAKRLFWADVLLGDNPERLQPEWRDRWWDEMSTMPLSGPGFLRKWRALADAALSTLSADAIRQGEGVDRYANDAAAKALYDSWSDQPGWVPWVEHGNSDMQERARRDVAL